MSRQHKTSELKARVLSAALNHFTEAGVERTNVGDILHDADISVGSLYHHFGSKEGVAEALFVEGVEQFNQNLLSELASHGSAERGVKSIVISCCHWVTEQPQLAAFMLSREIKLSEETKQELRELDRANRKALSNWFTPHIDAGHLKQLDFNIYVSIISGPTLEYSRMWLSGRYARSPATVAADMSEAAWQAVRR
ncbi:MAG: TetR/AcrR family transcriptional regulator [Pseudomonadota bacterium]